MTLIDRMKVRMSAHVRPGKSGSTVGILQVLVPLAGPREATKFPDLDDMSMSLSKPHLKVKQVKPRHVNVQNSVAVMPIA